MFTKATFRSAKREYEFNIEYEDGTPVAHWEPVAEPGNSGIATCATTIEELFGVMIPDAVAIWERD